MFRALAESRRRAMVERLAVGPATVSELATGVSLPTVLQHLGAVRSVEASHEPSRPVYLDATG